MNLQRAVKATIRSRRFWMWQMCGAAIYGIPVGIRFITGSVYLPILSLLETPWVDHYVPGNLVEKILVNAFFPGGAGAVAGEVFVSNRCGFVIRGKKKYFARLSGALVQTAFWSIFQLWGNLQNITGPYGGNLFEYPMVYPLNFLLASLSIFTPDVLGFVKLVLVKAYLKLSRRSSKD